MNRSETGIFGESAACDFLKKNKFSILGRNLRYKWGEIDILARDKKGTLVFVEVKTMTQGGDLKPEDHLTKQKLYKLQKTAELYVGHYPEKIRGERGWRIDLIAIEVSAGLSQEEEPYTEHIRHYENIH